MQFFAYSLKRTITIDNTPIANKIKTKIMLIQVGKNSYRIIKKRAYRKRTLLTKREGKKMTKYILSAFVALTLATAVYAQIPANTFAWSRNDDFVDGKINLNNAGSYYAPVNAPVAIIAPKGANVDKLAPETPKGVITEVTAYNAGDEAQTDNTPCIAASGDDICKLLEQGKKICAANAYPLHTKLYIDNYGECEVLDRMNSRFKNRVDIAMKKDEKARALKFGLQNLKVIKIK